MASEAIERAVNQLVEQDFDDIDYGPGPRPASEPTEYVYAGPFRRIEIAVFLRSMSEGSYAEVGTKEVYHAGTLGLAPQAWWIRDRHQGGSWRAYAFYAAVDYLCTVHAGESLSEQDVGDVDMGDDLTQMTPAELIQKWREAYRSNFVHAAEVEEIEEIQDFLAAIETHFATIHSFFYFEPNAIPLIWKYVEGRMSEESGWRKELIRDIETSLGLEPQESLSEQDVGDVDYGDWEPERPGHYVDIGTDLVDMLSAIIEDTLDVGLRTVNVSDHVPEAPDNVVAVLVAAERRGTMPSEGQLARWAWYHREELRR